jgi:hypothetical protein
LNPVMGADPGVMGCAMLSFVLWMLGYADQGRAGFRQALARAEALEQPPTVAFAHLVAGMMHLLLDRDGAAAQSHAAAMRGLGQARRFYGGFVEALAGQAQTAEADSAPPAVGSGIGQAAYLLVQAQACARASQAKTGLRAMDRALVWIEQSGVRSLEAEVWRMRGELLLKVDDGRRTTDDGETESSSGDAESCFRRALEIAREQGARWLELQTAVSLARLWQTQGRCDEARNLLSGVYGWFTEGFDTVDLLEAKALLQELQ